MNFINDDSFFNSNLIISWSGYTGEDGFEISVDNDVVLKVVDKLF